MIPVGRETVRSAEKNGLNKTAFFLGLFFVVPYYITWLPKESSVSLKWKKAHPGRGSPTRGAGGASSNPVLVGEGVRRRVQQYL